MRRMIYAVDDERDILELLEMSLIKAGYNVRTFEDGSSMLLALQHQQPDLLILDLMLPDMDGVDICRKIRQDKQSAWIPILMLTARSDETDKVLGLEFGADDYMTKPFSPRELMARIKAILRRGNQIAEGEVVSFAGSLQIHLQKMEAYVAEKKIDLTTTEYKILQLLTKRPGWVYSREQILDYLWGNEKIVIDRTIDVHIKNLREKLGDAGSLIRNVRGVGYKFEENQ